MTHPVGRADTYIIVLDAADESEVSDDLNMSAKSCMVSLVSKSLKLSKSA